jgi:hypothetical protein
MSRTRKATENIWMRVFGYFDNVSEANKHKWKHVEERFKKRLITWKEIDYPSSEDWFSNSVQIQYYPPWEWLTLGGLHVKKLLFILSISY